MASDVVSMKCRGFPAIHPPPADIGERPAKIDSQNSHIARRDFNTAAASLSVIPRKRESKAAGAIHGPGSPLFPGMTTGEAENLGELTTPPVGRMLCT
jgi:hypothetical protein